MINLARTVEKVCIILLGVLGLYLAVAGMAMGSYPRIWFAGVVVFIGWLWLKWLRYREDQETAKAVERLSDDLFCYWCRKPTVEVGELDNIAGRKVCDKCWTELINVNKYD